MHVPDWLAVGMRVYVQVEGMVITINTHRREEGVIRLQAFVKKVRLPSRPSIYSSGLLSCPRTEVPDQSHRPNPVTHFLTHHLTLPFTQSQATLSPLCHDGHNRCPVMSQAEARSTVVLGGNKHPGAALVRNNYIALIARCVVYSLNMCWWGFVCCYVYVCVHYMWGMRIH